MSSIMSRKIQTPHIHTVHTVHNYLIKINQLYKAAALQGERDAHWMHVEIMWSPFIRTRRTETWAGRDTVDPMSI